MGIRKPNAIDVKTVNLYVRKLVGVFYTITLVLLTLQVDETLM